MTTPNTSDKPPIAADRRTWTPMGRAILAGVRVRGEDLESTRGLHAVAIFLRVMSGLLLLLIAVQVVSGVTSAVDTSYRALFTEAIRLAIVSALLWGAAEFAELCIESHADLRATRILMARLSHRLDGPHPDDDRPERGPA